MPTKNRVRYRPSTSEAIAIFMATPAMQNAFWARVKLQAGCWLWLGFTKNGYGRFAIQGTQVYAHRLSYAYWYGVDPGELSVCHHCDNPPCTNPEHHFLGTQAENNADRDMKGRNGSTRGKTFIRGEQMGAAKLSEENAKEIIELHKAGVRQKEIAERFGLAQCSISHLINGKRWKHLHSESPEPLSATPPTRCAHVPSQFRSGANSFLRKEPNE